MLIGFQPLLQTLSENMPPVILLTGPAGIGKSVIATVCAERNSQIIPVSLPAGLTAETARELIASIQRKRVGGKLFVLINFDKVSQLVANYLLKTLEEPPKHVRFILYASKPVLPTIRSRAAVYACPPLSQGEVRQVLTEVLGWAPVRADICARIAGGSVGQGIARMESEPDRAAVIGFLRAWHEREHDRIPGYVDKFTEAQAKIAAVWAIESMTGVWSWFGPTDVPGVKGTTTTLAILGAPARPRLRAWQMLKTLTGA